MSRPTDHPTQRSPLERLALATEAANPVLATIAPGWSFCHDKGSGLAVRHHSGVQISARLRSSDRLWLAKPRRARHFGGTVEQAICQLVLWIRRLPRHPMRWWECACSEHVGLGSPLTLELLRANGYDDPAKTRCVLCGSDNPSDRWSLGRVIGPCCFGGRCRKET